MPLVEYTGTTAGTIGLLEGTVSDPIEPSEDVGAVDVRSTQTDLDDGIIQHGRVTGLVETTTEMVHADADAITVERDLDMTRRWTDWVADFTDAGFVAAGSTGGNTDIEFPFGTFEVVTGVDITPAAIDLGAFYRRQRDADNNPQVWMTGRKQETESDHEPDNTRIVYGEDALSKDAIQAEVNVGFNTGWQGKRVRGVMYHSGYVAVYNRSFGPVQFAQFVREEILPVATEAVEADDAQQSLDDVGGGVDA